MPGLGRRWQKGQSGNPGGRAKGLEALIRERTRDGASIVEFLLKAAKGHFKKMQFRDRVQAAQVLLDRGWGRPSQPIETADGRAVTIRVEYVNRHS